MLRLPAELPLQWPTWSEAFLEGRIWLMGEDYTIADIATVGWGRNLIGFYEAAPLVGYETHERPNLARPLPLAAGGAAGSGDTEEGVTFGDRA